jgi:hypothetical protein
MRRWLIKRGNRLLTREGGSSRLRLRARLVLRVLELGKSQRSQVWPSLAKDILAALCISLIQGMISLFTSIVF